MKNTINSKFLAIATILMLTVAAFMGVMPIGAQQEVPDEIPTYLKLAFAPNPVGKGQTTYVNAFMTKPPPTAGLGGSGDRYENITVEMTRPDGSEKTFGPFISDPTGGVWFSFTPQQIGEYTFQAFYPGEVLDLVNPHNPEYDPFGGADPAFNGTRMLSSQSAEKTLVVQEEDVTWNYDSPPLPDDYWTRPIYATNWDWAQIGGNWLGLAAPAFATTGNYDATGNFNNYTRAPDTPHIMWTKSTHFGGQPGAPLPSNQMSQYMSTTIATNFFEPVIINGVLYYAQFAGPTAEKASWKAVNLRTGETLWTKEPGITGDEVVRMGQVLHYHSMQEYGSWAFLYGIESAGFFQQPDFLNVYDPKTGEFLFNITNIHNVPFMMDDKGTNQGSLLGHYVSGGNLTLWNSTKLMMSRSWDQITIRPSGTYNWESGIEWSVPLPTELNGKPIDLGIARFARTNEVILLREAPSPSRFSELRYGYQITAGYDARTGEKLWGPKNQTLPKLQDTAIVAAGEGVYVLHNKDTNEAYGYSLETGNRLWGPVELEGNAWSHIQRAAEIAYGKVYIFDYGGYVNALDLQTGEIEWTFHRGSAGYDTPYGIYPLWYNGAVADGKLFLSEGSMYTPPLHPARRLAINCSNGELVWSILSYSGRMPAAIADGYLVEWNSFDNQIYAYGKGPTQTTLSIQDGVVSKGNSVMIKGTVMDISAGTKQDEIAKRFPNGLPAVADEDMRDWMEYVYMQQKCPSDVDGVQVKLEAVDPNGNTVDIGAVTSDGSGMFKKMWTPEIKGEYTVKAEFQGSDSYWKSSAETALGVKEAPEPHVTPTDQPAWYEEPASPTEQPTWYQEPPETVSPTEQPQWYQEPPATVSPTEKPDWYQEPPAYTTTDLAIIAAVIVAIVLVIVDLRINWAMRKQQK